MTPSTKKLISGFGVTVAFALLGTLGQYVAKLPPEVQIGALAVLSGAVHTLAAWGTQQGVDEKVLAKVTEVVGKEAP